jgi:hypothetical protein
VIEFVPIKPSALAQKNAQLRFKEAELDHIHKKMGINDDVDGISNERSELERCLYSVLIFFDNKEAVLNGIYYLERNVRLNPHPDNFLGSFNILKGKALSIGLSQAEVDASIFQARYDHILEKNANARAFKERFGDEVVKDFIRLWCEPSEQHRNKILNFANQFKPPYSSVEDGVTKVAYFDACVSLLGATSNDKALSRAFKYFL